MPNTLLTMDTVLTKKEMTEEDIKRLSAAKADEWLAANA